ncbi:MAG: DMT family transporter [Spirochaetia bacterium]|jgi:drug/metabolite transporter (DMT)-like permease|nr:DMT family transporter [Spirochaetia bacterium]
MKSKEQFKSEFMLIIVTIIWGGTFPVIKAGLADISPLLMVVSRFFIAFLFFLPFIIKKRKSIPKGLIKAGIILGFSTFVGYGMLTIGLTMTTVAKSSLISYGYALMTPPLQFLLLRKKVNPVNLIGLVIAFAGMMIFTSPSASGWNMGDSITVLVAVGYAFTVVLLDKYMRIYDVGVLTGFQFLFTALFSAVLIPFFEVPVFVPTFNLLIALFYLAIPGTVGALYLMNRFQKGTTPVRAVVIYALEPVIAIILGYMFLAEYIGLQELIGGVIILLGVLFSEIWGLFVSPKVKVNSI